MLEQKKVLLITTEMSPFLPETEMSVLVQKLSLGIYKRGKEVRNFMPKFGIINERRHQLHEVIRFSGSNLVIGDTNHSVFVKVAAVPLSRIQVYFVYNRELFQKKRFLYDDEGNELSDNDERSIFFVRGVIETVKKMRWTPDLIHCHGWMTALVPLFIRKYYNVNPCFEKTKLVYSVYNDVFQQPFRDQFWERIKMGKITANDIESIKDRIDFQSLTQLAIDFSDGVIQATAEIHPGVEQYIQKKKDLPFLAYQSEDTYIDAVDDFYNQILSQ